MLLHLPMADFTLHLHHLLRQENVVQVRQEKASVLIRTTAAVSGGTVGQEKAIVTLLATLMVLAAAAGLVMVSAAVVCVVPSTAIAARERSIALVTSIRVKQLKRRK